MFSAYNLFYQKKQLNDLLIAQDIQKLVQIFKQIDETCEIIDFDHQKNLIDFLNVGSFSGSEVGSMNLKYPEKWQGPYVEENPTMQEQPYMIVKTKKGLFIVPGEGVKLANGKVIGKDIILTPETDIEKLMSDKKALLFNNQSLATRLILKKNAKKPKDIKIMTLDEEQS
jgi:hypothetical protein